MKFEEDHGSIYSDRGERKYLTASERSRFIYQASLASLPLLALCLVLALTGCRISEALALTKAHVDREEGTLRFRTLKRRSTHCWRTIPVPTRLIELLHYLPGEEHDRLFPYHRTTAWRHISKLMEQAGIEGIHASPKGMRHYFGVQADAVGIPEPILQRWMGHSSLRSTSVYRQAFGEEEDVLADRMCWVT
ncbi:tyrosine-type recombinase/integrase [Parvularcula marina]|uniref:tyrosine-type recombinase/integrase n=1 Tax=Parvularcula marina TaxID=2292771 RepID=UPI003517D74C